MAFVGTQDLTIAGNATNIVHGNQYNSNTNLKVVKFIRVQQRSGHMSKQRRIRKKGAEIDLISDEYREIRWGDIYKVEQTGSTETEEYHRDDEGQYTWTKTGERRFYRAKLYGHDTIFTAITYTGKDASKLWRKDLAAFSESLDTATAFQLFGVNRSKVPALLLYDDWIPMAHFCPENFWATFYAQLLFSYMQCGNGNLWLNSQSGYISLGPDGPKIWGLIPPRPVDDLCTTADILNIDTCVRYLSKTASQDLDIDVLDCALELSGEINMCINDFFGVQHQCSQACMHTIDLEWTQGGEGLWWRTELKGHVADKVLDFLDDLDFNVVYSGTQLHKLTFSKGKGRLQNLDKIRHPAFYDQTVVAGGMTRFSLDFDFDLPWSISDLAITLSSNDTAMMWLSQAHRIFSHGTANDIDEKYGSEHDEPFAQLDDLDTESPVYLFVQPLPTRVSEVDAWLNSQVFFWSYDENGSTQIPGYIQRYLDLPKLTLTAPHILLRSWPKYVYDAIHTWQVARGFDPTTSDFARSLGFSTYQAASREDFDAETSMSETVDDPSRCQSDMVSSPTPVEDQESGSSSEEDQEPESRSLLSKFQSTLSWWQATSDIPAFG
ncbi:hypothetical protein VNI00_000448 [Paramarasmius palmivorus]|uniref:Uncharacterized protein n=1 Tax=Paramarasmius palmivorus TaxID=297713 RepID=A0AAW0E9D9_9AGAR